MPNSISPAEMERFLPVKEFAAKQGVSEWTVREWAHRHGLPHVRMGKLILIPPDALERMITTSPASTDVSTR